MSKRSRRPPSKLQNYISERITDIEGMLDAYNIMYTYDYYNYYIYFTCIVWCNVLCLSNNKLYVVSSKKLENIHALPFEDDIKQGYYCIWTPKNKPFKVKVIETSSKQMTRRELLSIYHYNIQVFT